MLLHWFKTLFADELVVLIEPEQISLIRTNKHLISQSNSVVKQRKTSVLAESLNNKNNVDKNWVELSAALKQALSEPICKNTTLKLLISNQFVKYAVVPWNQELTKSVERQEFAKHCFVHAFGDSVKNWDIQVCQAIYQQSAIASAIESSLLSTINAALNTQSVASNVVMPQLMLVINHVFSEIKNKKLLTKQQVRDGFWIACIQQQRLCLALFDANGWQVVKNTIAETDVIAQLNTLLHRETVNHNLQKNLPIMLYWPDSKSNRKGLPKTFISISPHYLDAQKNAPKHNKDWALA